MAGEIQPLFTEAEAARKLGVRARSLRSERVAGRITFRKVAGKIMYRADDLAAWQENIAICHDQTKDRASGKTRGAAVRTGSTGPTPQGAAAALAQAHAIKRKLLDSSPDGSQSTSTSERTGPARVVPLKPKSSTS